MVNISKKYLKQEIKNEIRRSLIKDIRVAKTEKDFDKIISRILTPDEQVMIEKRLGILCLLKRKLPYREIGRTLNVSSHTISFTKRGFIKKERKPRQYSSFESAKKRRSSSRFPTYTGKGRWRFLDGY